MKKILISLIVLLISSVHSLEPKNCYAVTIPKSGTNLLAKALKLLTRQNVKRYNSNKLLRDELPSESNTIFFSHVVYEPSVAKLFADNKYAGLFMIRDPRDVVISKAFWLVSHPKLCPGLFKKYQKNPAFFSQLLKKQIQNIKKTYDSFMSWNREPNFYTVRFEKLVGTAGGGNDSQQLEELANISRHCGLDLSNDFLQEVAGSLFGGTMTFRKGVIGGWKNYFNKKHKALFKEVAGQLLIDLGYETDFNW